MLLSACFNMAEGGSESLRNNLCSKLLDIGIFTTDRYCYFIQDVFSYSLGDTREESLDGGYFLERC